MTTEPIVAQAPYTVRQAVLADLDTLSLTLQTAKDNLSAQALYEATGWVREETFIEYKLMLRD